MCVLLCPPYQQSAFSHLITMKVVTQSVEALLVLIAAAKLICNLKKIRAKNIKIFKHLLNCEHTGIQMYARMRAQAQHTKNLQ